MKLKYRLINRQLARSFHIYRQTNPYQESNWHFHEEYELIYTIKGKGLRIVGDDISDFDSPQLALIGSKLPHLWKNNPDDSRNQKVDVVIIQFNRLFAGQDIFSTPELAAPEVALRFADAASYLGHLIYGYFNYVSRSEVENSMDGSTSGRVVR